MSKPPPPDPEPWVRLPGATPNDDPESDSEMDIHLAMAVYGRGGKKWPRLVITIEPGLKDLRLATFHDHFTVCVQTKNKPDEWWRCNDREDVGIPFALYPDLLALLAEAKDVYDIFEHQTGGVVEKARLARALVKAGTP